jgi:hypothetical protein
MVAETPKTPKPVLMDIAMHYRGHSGSIGSTANQNAYATLAGLNSSFTGSRNILTPDDLIQLAGSVDTRVRTFVLINPQTPFPTIISLLTDGLCVSTETRNNPAHEWALSVFDRIKHELSPMQIARLAKGRNAQLLTGKILELPKTPRSIVLEQAKDGYRDDICTAACERLGLDLTIDEIIFLSHSVRPGAAHAVAAFKQKQETLTTAELDVVAEKAGFPILEEVAKHPQTSQKTLLQLAKHGYVAAYLRIKDQIPTREALTPFMSVPNLLLEVAKHPQLEAAEVAGLLVSNIHTKTVIDEPEEGEYEYDHSDPFNTDYQGRPLPSSYRVTKPAVTHEEYPEEELAKAREILQAQEAKRAGIIAVLRREKPLLAEKLA